MDSMEQRLNKLREERIAREKSRIDKLRELNLKKYNKAEAQNTPKPFSNVSMSTSTLKTDSKAKIDANRSKFTKNTSTSVKNNFHVNGPSKQAVSAPKPFKKPEITSIVSKKPVVKTEKSPEKYKVTKSNLTTKTSEKKDFVNSNKIISKSNAKIPANSSKFEPKIARKSSVPLKPQNQTKLSEKPKIPDISRKSILPTKVESKNRESVFDRLYKPKTVQKKDVCDADRLHKDPIFLQKVMQQSGLIVNKRHTVFEPKQTRTAPVRRSISAVHFKRISKKELDNCFQKWSSISDKLNEEHLKDVNEDDSVKQDVVTSAVRSERKKVRLHTPLANFNTPRPDELQSRLIKWLKSRGKSINAYQHLQCFGVQHLAEKSLKPLYLSPVPQQQFDDDDENKENVALEHDSDNDSYTDNMNDRHDDFNNDFNSDGKLKWRSRVSYASDSAGLNVSKDTTLNSDELLPVEDLLLGALNDLTELLREGFDWEQCARWLRAIRERFPHAPNLAAYWECRAALEERRGDLPASVQCWEEAIAKGTQHSVVDANLDQLLDKFMQLKISPSSGKRERVDPKLVDVKNVFKSTIIRFAVQQAKLRNTNQQDVPKYTMTPVRRSSRLSAHWSSKKTPLQICSSVKQASQLGKVLFVPNSTLCDTP